MIITDDHGDPILLEKYEEARKRLYTDYDTLERAPFYKSLDTLLEKITQKHLEFFNVKDQILQILGPSFTQEEYDELYMKLSPPYLKDIEIMQKEFSFRAKEVQNYLVDIYAYTTANHTVESVLMDMSASNLSLSPFSLCHLSTICSSRPCMCMCFNDRNVDDDRTLLVSSPYTAFLKWGYVEAGLRCMSFAVGSLVHCSPRGIWGHATQTLLE